MNIKITPDQVTNWVLKNFPDCKPRKGGLELRINNPLMSDSGFNCNINIESLYVNDWRGNEWVGIDPRTGKRRYCTFLRFVQLYLTQQRGFCSFTEALQDVLGAATNARAILMRARRQVAQETQEKGTLKPPEGTTEFALEKPTKLERGLLSWLASRGVDEQKIKKYHIKHSGLDVVFLYYEYDEFVYWQTRSRISKTFLFPSQDTGVTKGQFLYGFDQAEPASFLIITEAIFGTLTLEDQCLASGGASLTAAQVKKISLLGPRDGVILSPDNDKAGLESILANAALLKPYAFKLFYALPPALPSPKGTTKDWNELVQDLEMPPKEVRAIFEKSVKPLTIQANLYLRDRLDQLKSIR